MNQLDVLIGILLLEAAIGYLTCGYYVAYAPRKDTRSETMLMTAITPVPQEES